jgi:hypothetical protein
MRRIVLVVGLIGSFLVVGASASAQTVTGTVVDAANARPLGGAAVSVLTGNTTVGVRRTNDSGRFEIPVPAAGAYTVRVVRLGHAPTTTSVRVAAGGHAAVYRLSAVATTLDPVTARADAAITFAMLTPGRELYHKHLALNTGQLASGLEIQQSRLTVAEFLGKLIPGLKLVPSVPPPAPGSDHPNSPATIPGTKGFVVASGEQPCLFARIDRWGLAGLLDMYDATYLDEILDATDIMGVEVYSRIAEVPTEYRADAQGKQLVWRTGAAGRNYLVGDIGMPPIPRPTIRANPSEDADERTTPREVRWLRSVGASANTKPPLDTLWHYCKGKIDEFGNRWPASSYPSCLELKPQPDSIFDKIVGRLVPIDTVQPPSFALPSMGVPPCGFVQVWTRIAW